MSATPSASLPTPPAVDFLWRSIEHLEARVTTVDNKANILLGLLLAVAAAVGALAREALTPWDGSGLMWLAAALLVADGAWVVRLVFDALTTLNPRSAAAAGRSSKGYRVLSRPEPYVLWPRSGEPWHEDPDLHARALTDPNWQHLLANLAYTQWTIVCLIDAKYDRYRAAVKEFRVFTAFQLFVVASLFVAL